MANVPAQGEPGIATALTIGAAVVVWILLSVIVVGAALLLADDSNEPAYAQTVDIELGDFFINPSAVPVAADTELTLRVVNNGDIQHVEEEDDGSYESHFLEGMVNTLTVS